MLAEAGANVLLTLVMEMAAFLLADWVSIVAVEEVARPRLFHLD